ncbi:hypothetical protein [Paracoccus sp. (in: a-proteobacteria)]|uniref:hypothetical protein n=1 Tax=Paracoccus sp. TaxID=267 RepID=UPI0028983DD8|nr:hypothetical protein [Paracoccus sp. (in: a-proteobacteria)]
MAENAEATAQEWAENSLDSYAGELVPVTNPAAKEALRRVYRAVLARGGVDHVEPIDFDAALTFPSHTDRVKPNAVMAYIGHGIATGDYSLSIDEFAQQRLRIGAWLAAGIDRDGILRFSLLSRRNDGSRDFDKMGRHDALRILAFETLDPAAKAAFHRAFEAGETPE